MKNKIHSEFNAVKEKLKEKNENRVKTKKILGQIMRTCDEVFYTKNYAKQLGQKRSCSGSRTLQYTMIGLSSSLSHAPRVLCIG